MRPERLLPANERAVGRIVRRVVRPALLLAATLPAGALALGAWRGTLGANPIEALLDGTGIAALRFLLLCLAVSPLRRLTGIAALAPLRRTLGLIAFAYAALHLAVWALLDVGELAGVLDDLGKRPFIAIGALTFSCLLMLGLTSTKRAIRRLGPVRWRALHRLIYPAAILATLHFAAAQKADLLRPLVHGAILAGLLAARRFAPRSPARNPRARGALG